MTWFCEILESRLSQVVILGTALFYVKKKVRLSQARLLMFILWKIYKNKRQFRNPISLIISYNHLQENTCDQTFQPIFRGKILNIYHDP